MGGKASATPELLHNYSDDMTRRCGDLAAWVRGKLAQEIADFEAGATKYGQGIFSGYNRIDVLVSSALTRAWTTDTEVGRVGTLFQIADGGDGYYTSGPYLEFWDIPPSRPVVPPPPDGWVTTPDPPTRQPGGGNDSFGLPPGVTTAHGHIVTTTDGDIDKAVTTLGAGLAGRYAKGDLTDTDILEYVKEPAAIAALLNNLSPDDLGRALKNEGLQALLVNLIAKGLLTDKTMGTVAHLIADWPDYSAPERADLMSRLAGSPEAAADLVRYLQKDPDLLKRFLDGSGWQDSDYSDTMLQREFLRLLTGAAPKLNRGELSGLVDFLNQNLPKSPDIAIVKVIEPDLTRFLITVAPRLIDPPPNTPDITKIRNDWVQPNADLLKKLLLNGWLDKQFAGDHEWEVTKRTFLENMFVGYLGSFFPGGPAKDAIWGGVGGLVVQPTLDKGIKLAIPYPPEAAPSDPNGQVRYLAFTTTFAFLVERGLIPQPAAPETFEGITKSPEFQKLLNSFVNGTYNDDPKIRAWANQFGALGIYLDALYIPLDPNKKND